MPKIEFIITLRCKTCGDIASLEIPINFADASTAIQKFKDEHEHPTPNPWVI
jgi:hypothetical protein